MTACRTHFQGSFALPAAGRQNAESAQRACVTMCRSCNRCRYISVAPPWKHCSWFSTCDMEALQQHVKGSRSGLVPRTARSSGCQLLLFRHLRKTGGNSIQDFLHQHFGVERNFSLFLPYLPLEPNQPGNLQKRQAVLGWIESMERNETPTSGVVAGYHVVYDNADEFYRLWLRARSLSTRRCPARAFTVLRAPEEAAASWYRYKKMRFPDRLVRQPDNTTVRMADTRDDVRFEKECTAYSQASELLVGHAAASLPSPSASPTSAQDALELFTAVGVVSQMADVAAWLCSLLRRDAVDDHTAACEASFRVLNPTLQTSGERAGQALNTRLRETMHARNISTACPTELIRPEDRALYATALTRAAGLRELAAGGA